MEYFVVIRSKPRGFRRPKMLKTLLDRSYSNKELAMLVLDMACQITKDKLVVYGINCQTQLDL